MCIDNTYCWKEENESLIRYWIVWEVEINVSLALQSFCAEQNEGCRGDYIKHCKNWQCWHSIV